MIENKPFIHLFRTPGGYYIYDVNTNKILKVQRNVYELLQSWGRDEEDSTDEEALKVVERMKSEGYLSSKRISEIVHPLNEKLPNILENKITMITLQVTQQCNFRCEYCVYSGIYQTRGHSNNKMTFETARKGIDFLIDHSKDLNQVHIAFYGGEPLLEFDLVKKCMEYAIEKGEGKQIYFGITTNATLLNEEIIDYFEKHKVGILISLDGPKHIHDRHRRFAGTNSGTFDKVIENIELIKRKYPEYMKLVRFSVVLDTTVDRSCISEFFTNFEAIKESNLAVADMGESYLTTEKSISEDYIKGMEYEKFMVLLTKLDKLDEKYAPKLALDSYTSLRSEFQSKLVPRKSLPDKGHHGGPCVPGARKLFMSVDGTFYPCEKVSEESEVMKIGHVDEGFNLDKVRAILNVGKVTENKCKNCWAFDYCPMCAIVADDLKQISAEMKMSKCASSIWIVQQMMESYCMLKEFGHDFTDRQDLSYFEI